MPDPWTPEVTVTYVNDEGEEVTLTRTLTEDGVGAILDAMDTHSVDN
ncbi:hypothetical protein ACWDX6_23820 [Streptomyces sp. NPDC003027]